MKKLPLIIFIFVFCLVFFSPSVFAASSVEPVPTTDTACPLGSTIYPPNSKCYSPVKSFEVQEVNLSGDQLFTYPLSCITAPTVTYRETYTSKIPPPLVKTPVVTTDIKDAQLGFLGPDSNTLATMNPDKLAQKYLFNALFDRPSTDPNSSKESFRTFWRMLDSLSQAQIKAFYIQNTTNHIYFYVGQDKKQHQVYLDQLRLKLPFCLKNYGIAADILACWSKNTYAENYLNLDQTTRDEYDALLPFDFENMRSYIVLGTTVSKENIPYLKAILSGLKGQKTLLSSVPGLFDFYTPSWATQEITKHLTAPTILEPLQYPSLMLRASLSSCQEPTKTSSLSSPKTQPDVDGLSQIVTVPISSTLVSSTPSECNCRFSSSFLCSFFSCESYGGSQSSCNSHIGCSFVEGEDTYELTGTAKGKHITVFNNPNIETLNDLIVGGKDPVGSNSASPILSNIAGIINDVIGFFSNSQPSFYKMLLPSFAPNVEKTVVRAPAVSTTTSEPHTSVSGANSVIRENNLAQDNMHLLQNCWLVPSDQQTSSKCGKGPAQPVGECALSEEPLTGVCSKASFASSMVSGIYNISTPITSYIPLVTPELSAVYAEAERITGVSCVTLAAIHFMEAGNDPCMSLVSGRRLGVPEPDEGGKIYSTLLETAIDAGNELAGKGATVGAPADKVIQAMSNFNGNGNANCRSDPPATEYGGCPPVFRGEDDPYATSLMDAKHRTMFLRCPYDGYCGAVAPFNRPGAFAVAYNYYNSLP